MPTTLTPLRYPGGKSALVPAVVEILRANGLFRGHYVEPYAGGAGLALRMVLHSHMWKGYINDLDKALYAFWWSVLNTPEALCARITATTVTVQEWRRQNNIWQDPQASRLDLGFAALFLNRTNRSGILRRAGVIGGLAQSGRYKIDARYNKAGLQKKILRIARYRSRIHLFCQDAEKFMDRMDKKMPEDTLFYIDPPYCRVGAALYTNHYQLEDHERLAQRIRKLRRPWVLTYDDAPEIARLYAGQRTLRYRLNYSACQKRQGVERMIFSDNLRLPKRLPLHLA